MVFSKFVRTAGTLVLVGALAACVDFSLELEVVNDTHGIGKTSVVMDRASFDELGEAGGAGFCDEDNEVFTLSDTAATCTTIEKGVYAELFEESDDNEPTPTITSAGPGLVRVAFPTAAMMDDVSEDADDPESQALIQQMFAGRVITLTVSGGEIMETNMTIADDGQSAFIEIPFVDLLSGEADLPEESFAVVKHN